MSMYTLTAKTVKILNDGTNVAVIGIFTSLEKAEEEMEKQIRTDILMHGKMFDEYEICEFEVDTAQWLSTRKYNKPGELVKEEKFDFLERLHALLSALLENRK